MAVLQGLQALVVAVQSDGAITLAALNIQQKIHSAQLAIENALTSQSVIVRGAATVAQKALNLAMSASPIGIILVALTAIIPLLLAYGKNAQQAARDTAALNAALFSANEGLNAYAQGIENANARIVSDLEVSGAKQSQILRQNLTTQKQINAERQREIDNLRNTIQNSVNAEEEVISESRKRLFELEQDQQNAVTEVYVAENAIRRQILDEEKEAREKAIADAKKAEEERRKLILSRLNDELAALERQLLAAEQAGTETINIQKKIIAQKARIELEGENLTANQRKLIQERALVEQDNLLKEFRAKQLKEGLEAQIQQNNAALAELELSNEERLSLTIDNIIAAAQIEIEAAQGNSAKIIEINAKRDADIRAARLAAIEKDLADELSLIESRSGAYRRSQERIANDEKKTNQERFAAIDQLTNYQIASGEKRIQALDEELEKGLISQQDYNIQYEKLIDEQAKVVEDAEARKAAIAQKTIDDQKKKQQELIQTTIDLVGQGANILGSLFDFQAERENQYIQGQRDRLDELRESGAITEREAIAREKRIDQEEKKIRRQQAQREKNLAIFNAILNGANATLRALATGGPILAAIVGGLAAAQVALIASQPIPKFRKGKKDSYQGLGEVGEAGAELIESNGQMYIAKNPSIVWLGAKDKVYTPSETKTMIHEMTVDKSVMKPLPGVAEKLDYDKLGKIIGKEVGNNIPQSGLNIDENGFVQWVASKNSFEKYLSKRRRGI